MQVLNKLLEMSKKKHSLVKAIEWVKKNRIAKSGIRIHHKTNQVYAEVTGYLIDSLYESGEKELALDLAKWEASVQQPNGAFLSPAGVEYTFDTAQVMRGFLKVVSDIPKIENNLRKAADFVSGQIDEKGIIKTPSYASWKLRNGNMLSYYSYLYILSPLREAGKYFNEPKYTKAANRALDRFKTQPDLTEFKSELGTLSHIFGYMMEALVDLGEIDLAKKGLAQAASIQRKDGSIPAYPGVDWVCSTGVAQLAIAWYKLGDIEPAKKAFKYLEKIQNSSGGFYGSYGPGALYLPKKEISWAVKFFIDLYHWHIKSMFNQEINILDYIGEEDGRVQEILSNFCNIEQGKIVEIGCGTGRFLKAICKYFPDVELHAMDISENYLKNCPNDSKKSCGSILNIPYPDNYFDGIYSVETLEHAVLVENAIRELVRVLKPGGKLVIIDKNRKKLGSMKILPFEQWFSAEQILTLLKKYNIKAYCKYIDGGSYVKADELFISWHGIKEEL